MHVILKCKIKIPLKFVSIDNFCWHWNDTSKTFFQSTLYNELKKIVNSLQDFSYLQVECYKLSIHGIMHTKIRKYNLFSLKFHE